jgi:serine phosphatase RsbU (regulator of sigma subunit)/CHASE2 domain-containing sensor protein
VNESVGPAASRSGRIRVIGITALLALTLLIALETPLTAGLSAQWFDAMQTIAPRTVHALPATIVAIDEASLAEIGQWPWPRSKLAKLVRAIHEDEPLAIAVDILMPEPDALSPERALEDDESMDHAVASALPQVRRNDKILAEALGKSHAILVLAGSHTPTANTLRAPPISVRDPAHSGTATTPSAPALVQYQSAVTSLDVLDGAAAGHGLISVDPEGGVIRRVPLVASVHGTLVPALAIEMLRVAVKAPLRVLTRGTSVESVAVGDIVIPTEHDGEDRIYYSHRREDRFVSAIDILRGRAEPGRLKEQLVIVGLTGLGLIEYQNTPIGERMLGSEIHAQILENIADQAFLTRPAFARGLEALAFLLLGAMLLYATPRWKPQFSALLALGCIVVPALAAFVAFRSQRLLFDWATPSLSLILFFCGLLVLTLAEATRQKRQLERVVQQEREQSARIAGELDAAHRIQTATLPRDDLLAGDDRIELGAIMVPARETGGDLYDFFGLPEDRLFFLIGDVAGKGLSASIFMAVSKALYKSATLRSPRMDVGELMSIANAEISRDNPEMLFVTAFAGILDLNSGELSYCNAGQENPYVLRPANASLERIEDGDGPPLCSVSDVGYRGARRRMHPGELLCLITDGVTDARNPQGELYGRARVDDLLQRLGAGASARAVADALRADVAAFAAGADPTDDLSILVLKWAGPRVAGGADEVRS